MAHQSASIPSAVPIPLRTITSTTLPEVVQQAIQAAKTDKKPLDVRCSLGVYIEGDYRSWPGVRWIVQLPPGEATQLQATLTSFFTAVSTGKLAELQTALDDWARG